MVTYFKFLNSNPDNAYQIGTFRCAAASSFAMCRACCSSISWFAGFSRAGRNEKMDAATFLIRASDSGNGKENASHHIIQGLGLRN